jgi:hypothetical protein
VRAAAQRLGPLGPFGGIFGYLTGSYHTTDASRQVTFSCTSTATEPDTGDLLARIFTDEHEPG